MRRTFRRRRKEAKTDYQLRLGLLKSGKPRIVVRKTNRYIIVQLVHSEIAQDKVIINLSSKDLLQHGWPKDKSGSLKSRPAAYLTGFLMGKKVPADNKEAILDIGMQRNVKKSRIYSVLKGLVDAGMKLSYNEEIVPTEEELTKKEDLLNLVKKIKEKL